MENSHSQAVVNAATSIDELEPEEQVNRRQNMLNLVR